MTQFIFTFLNGLTLAGLYFLGHGRATPNGLAKEKCQNSGVINQMGAGVTGQPVQEGR